eukprot:298021-Prorocentrum_minimum.AAC.2
MYTHTPLSVDGSVLRTSVGRRIVLSVGSPSARPRRPAIRRRRSAVGDAALDHRRGARHELLPPSGASSSRQFSGAYARQPPVRRRRSPGGDAP